MVDGPSRASGHAVPEPRAHDFAGTLGELGLTDGENPLWQCSPRPVPAEGKNRYLLVGLFGLWLTVTGWFVITGNGTGAVFLVVFGGICALVARGQQNAAEQVEYFVTGRRIVVHTDEDGQFEAGTGTIIFAGAEDRRRRRVVPIDRARRIRLGAPRDQPRTEGARPRAARAELGGTASGRVVFGHVSRRNRSSAR